MMPNKVFATLLRLASLGFMTLVFSKLPRYFGETGYFGVTIYGQIFLLGYADLFYLPGLRSYAMFRATELEKDPYGPSLKDSFLSVKSSRAYLPFKIATYLFTIRTALAKSPNLITAFCPVAAIVIYFTCIENAISLEIYSFVNSSIYSKLYYLARPFSLLPIALAWFIYPPLLKNENTLCIMLLSCFLVFSLMIRIQCNLFRRKQVINLVHQWNIFSKNDLSTFFIYKASLVFVSALSIGLEPSVSKTTVIFSLVFIPVSIMSNFLLSLRNSLLKLCKMVISRIIMISSIAIPLITLLIYVTSSYNLMYTFIAALVQLELMLPFLFTVFLNNNSSTSLPSPNYPLASAILVPLISIGLALLNVKYSLFLGLLLGGSLLQYILWKKLIERDSPAIAF